MAETVDTNWTLAKINELFESDPKYKLAMEFSTKANKGMNDYLNKLIESEPNI
jgi:hypothetical protein